MPDTSARIALLRREIEEHDKRYYDEAAPTVSDAEYDALFRELRALEAEHPELIPADSPTQRVGGKPSEGFRRVRHTVEMLSLDNLFAADGPEPLRKYIAGIEEMLAGEPVAWFVEPKIDGVAVSLRFEHGKFVLGATRGDGVEGDDITGNLRTILSLPSQLHGQPPAVLEVRGEVFMPEAAFQRQCDEQRTAGDTVFKNPRNATAGSLKQLDPREVARRGLAIVIYGVGDYSGDLPPTQQALLAWLAEFGLPTPRFQRLCHSTGEVMAAIDALDAERFGYGFETDGAVIKVNDLAQRERLGNTSRFPRGARAWKYPPERKATRLLGITVQVGRTGALTPVAELEPVELARTEVRRATLHNVDEIERKDIRIGDTVLVEKAGEIIPAVVGVVLEKRPADAGRFDFLAHIGEKCPACGGPVRRDPQFVVWKCENLLCPAQKTRRLEYFAKRGALDLEGLGGIVADKLVERGLVADPLDVFKLTADQLAKLNLGTEEEPRIFGEKNATKLIEAIQRAKTLPLARWLLALAIHEVGETTAHDLAKLHATIEQVGDSPLLRGVVELDRLREAEKAASPRAKLNKDKTDMERQQLATSHAEFKTAIAGLEAKLDADGFGKDVRKKIGPVVANAVLAWFASDAGHDTLARLREAGIAPEGGEASASGQPFSGKTFVLTGTLETMSRGEASEKIRALGGNVSSSVSRKTHYVIAGPGAGSKLDEARAHGVTVLDERQFVAMLGAASVT